MIFSAEQKQRHRRREQMCGHSEGEGEGRMTWETEVNVYTLRTLCFRWAPTLRDLYSGLCGDLKGHHPLRPPTHLDKRRVCTHLSERPGALSQGLAGSQRGGFGSQRQASERLLFRVWNALMKVPGRPWAP